MRKRLASLVPALSSGQLRFRGDDDKGRSLAFGRRSADRKAERPSELMRGSKKKWQEWRDSNPRPSVLETDALPAELHSCSGAPFRSADSLWQGASKVSVLWTARHARTGRPDHSARDAAAGLSQRHLPDGRRARGSGNLLRRAAAAGDPAARAL